MDSTDNTDKMDIDVINFKLEKAERVYKSAGVMLRDGDYESAVNRAYYCVFHTICALLLLDGKSYKEHSAVLAEFNKNYLRFGVFTEFSFKMVNALSDARNKSDYTDMFYMTAEKANGYIVDAKLIHDAIKTYIRNRIKNL